MDGINYEPVTEIIIHVGEKNEYTDLSKLRVYINGKKINNLRGFKFKSKLDEPPVMTVERYPY